MYIYVYLCISMYIYVYLCISMYIYILNISSSHEYPMNISIFHHIPIYIHSISDEYAMNWPKSPTFPASALLGSLASLCARALSGWYLWHSGNETPKVLGNFTAAKNDPNIQKWGLNMWILDDLLLRNTERFRFLRFETNCWNWQKFI